MLNVFCRFPLWFYFYVHDAFNDGSTDILYLNKQRLMAVEMMRKTQHEKQLLLNRVEQLEVELASIQESSNILNLVVLVILRQQILCLCTCFYVAAFIMCILVGTNPH